MLILELVAFGLALWLGLYLIGRDPAKPTLRYAGLGLVSYAFSLASALLASLAPTLGLTVWLTRLHWSLLFLPALVWLGAMMATRSATMATAHQPPGVRGS